MATVKQPEEGAEDVVEAGNDWFLQFLERVELHLPEGGELTPNSGVHEVQARPTH
jgi:hypothetical protein